MGSSDSGGERIRFDPHYNYVSYVLDDFMVGATAKIAKFSVTGDADEIQTIIKANSSQTANIFEVQNSSSNVLSAIQPHGAFYSNNAVLTNLFLGYETGLNVTASGIWNTLVGYRAGYNITDGFGNTVIGHQAGQGITTGTYNQFFGNAAGIGTQDGANNIAIGRNALVGNVSGQYNVALGHGSLQAETTSYNTAVGAAALNDVSGGVRNTAVGYAAMNKVNPGDYNTAVGWSALGGVDASSDINSNTAVGYEAGDAVITGADENVFIGTQTGYTVSTGAKNIFIGYQAGFRQTTNSNLLIIDNQARADQATELSNAILYGVMAATPANQTLRFNADVGIGVSPSYPLHVSGKTYTTAHSTSGTTDYMNYRYITATSTASTIGMFIRTRDQNLAGTSTGTYSLWSIGSVVNSSASSMTSSYSRGAVLSNEYQLTSSGDLTITGGYGMVAGAPSITKTGGGTLLISNQYGITISNQGNAYTTVARGLNIADQSGATSTNHAIYTGTGDVHFGDQVTIVGSSDVIQLEVQANSSQTANMVEIDGDDGTGRLIVNRFGELIPIGRYGTTSSVIIGDSAGRNTTGGNNVAIGQAALSTNISGTYNTAVGRGAGQYLTNDYNTAVGALALGDQTNGLRNTAVGYAAIRENKTGDYNVAVGMGALAGTDSLSNINRNVAVGYYAGASILTDADNNTLIGSQAGYTLASGSGNIFLGNYAGYRQDDNDNLLIIDNQQRADQATEESNAIIYGVMDAAVANQSLRFNADVDIYGDTKWVGGGGVPFGSCYGNEIAWSQASAVQNTWYDISDSTMVDGQLHNVTHDGNGQLTVSVAGMYAADWYGSFEADAQNVHVQVTFSVNGTETNDGINHFETFGTNTQQAMSGNAILDLAASDTINVSIRTTDAGTPDLAIDHLGLRLVHIGGT
jgi:hypothetical protein